MVECRIPRTLVTAVTHSTHVGRIFDAHGAILSEHAPSLRMRVLWWVVGVGGGRGVYFLVAFHCPPFVVSLVALRAACMSVVLLKL